MVMLEQLVPGDLVMLRRDRGIVGADRAEGWQLLRIYLGTTPSGASSLYGYDLRKKAVLVFEVMSGRNYDIISCP